MNITFIGTGNCASILSRLCIQKGHQVIRIVGRNPVTGIALAGSVQAEYVNFSAPVNTNTDLVIVALSDNALPEALAGMNFGDIPVMHTAGAVSMNVLKTNSANYGILYPLQSVSKDLDHVPVIPLIIEGNNEFTKKFIKSFALTLSDKVEELNEEKRLRLHAAAVIVNNFTNYLYNVAKTFCEQENIDFNLLKPLIIETAERIRDHSPGDMQTGPAIRKDITTLDKHLRLLSAYPKLRTMYMRMTDSIMNP